MRYCLDKARNCAWPNSDGYMGGTEKEWEGRTVFCGVPDRGAQYRFYYDKPKTHSILSDALRGIGQIPGFKASVKLGERLDKVHKQIKDLLPLYKPIEEGSSEFVRRRITELCSGLFQVFTNSLIAYCSNWDGRVEDQHLIRDAVTTLVKAGVFQSEEFTRVQIRWCPLPQGGDGDRVHGVAPDRGRVYLDTAAKDSDPFELASLLAHEMMHIRQYRRMGTDQFKCEYSIAFGECFGCQDRRHRLEREAYNFEGQVYDWLVNDANRR